MKNILLSKFNPEYPIPLNLVSVGENSVQVPIYRKHGYPIYHLTLCTNGSGILITDRGSESIEKDTFFLLVPGESHSYAPNNQAMSMAWITFNGELAGEITESLQLVNKGVMKFNQPDNIYDRFYMIMRIIRDKDQKCSYRLSSELYTLLLDIYYDLHFNEVKFKNTGEKLETVFKFIDSNWNNNIGTREMAECAGITPQYLCSLFRKYEGVTPREYLIRYRIIKSKELMSDMNHTVNDISILSGFNDSSYFCAVFKKYEGITPKKYRTLLNLKN